MLQIGHKICYYTKIDSTPVKCTKLSSEHLKPKKSIFGSWTFSSFFLADLMHVWIIFFIAGMLTSEPTLTMDRQNWSHKTASFPTYSKEQESLFASWSRTNPFTGSSRNTRLRRKTNVRGGKLVVPWWTLGKWWSGRTWLLHEMEKRCQTDTSIDLHHTSCCSRSSRPAGTYSGNQITPEKKGS